MILAFTGAIFIFMATAGPKVLTVVSRAFGSGFSHAMFISLEMVAGETFFCGAVYHSWKSERVYKKPTT